MQAGNILVSELQLGQRLNQCVREGNKSEFDLLLSMLSTDVGDQDQFSTINTVESEQATSLRAQFDVPQAQLLSSRESSQQDYSISLADLAREEGLVAARFQHCLRPSVLHFDVDRIEGFADDVTDNISPTVEARLLGQDLTNNKPRINFDDVIAAQKDYDAQLFVA